MKEVRLTLYKFEELPREIIDKIVDKERWNVQDRVMESYGWDYKASLEAFEKLTDSQAVNWQVDYCAYHYRVNVKSIMLDEDYYPDESYVEELTGKHLFRYVIENIYPYLLDKEQKLKECPLTGMCYDYYLLEPLLKYLNDWRSGNEKEYDDQFTYAKLIEQCYESFFSEWHKEYEYWGDTDSAIEEELVNWYEGALFDVNGVKCNVSFEEVG